MPTQKRLLKNVDLPKEYRQDKLNQVESTNRNRCQKRRLMSYAELHREFKKAQPRIDKFLEELS